MEDFLFRSLLEEARNLPRETVAVDYFLKKLYRDHVAALSGDEAMTIEEVATAQRPKTFEQKAATYIGHNVVGNLVVKTLALMDVQPRIPALMPIHPRQLPSPEIRKARRERRYGLERGKRGVLIPPTFATCLTPSEAAVLVVIAVEIIKQGFCDLYIGQMGAFAGCGERTVRSALKRAKELGLISVLYRRDGKVNKTNLITASSKWAPWLASRGARNVTRQISAADLGSRFKKEGKKEDKEERGYPGDKVASSTPSRRTVEPRRDPVRVTDLRTEEQRARDEAEANRWRTLIEPR